MYPSGSGGPEQTRDVVASQRLIRAGTALLAG